MNRTMRRTTTTLVALAGALALALPASALASGPTKFVLSFHIGGNVDKTKIKAGAPQEERNECTVASKDECQPGAEGTGPREFKYPESVVVAPDGDVYVADKVNHRVQELNPEGRFVSMFGWNVNKTKVALGGGATQQEKNVCTAVSKDECGEGEKGEGLPGQLFGGQDVAIDPATGNVYVLEVQYHRVEEFTPTGEFMLMIGGEVNKKGGDICTKAEEGECKAGVEGTGHGSFEKPQVTDYGNLLAVGPEDHLLYVGDEARVQKFEANGKWVGPQISLAGLSPAGLTDGVAVDRSGDVFVADEAVPGVHEYNEKGELQPCVIDPASTSIHAIALDSHERLGVIEQKPQRRGLLYGTQGGECGEQKGGAIAPPSGEMSNSPTGLAFGFNKTTLDALYVADFSAHEVEAYAPVLFPEVRTCPTEKGMATSVLLCGEINPNGLPTTGFFRYGTSVGSLGSLTPTAFTSKGEAFEPVRFTLTGLVPNEIYYDEAFAEAEVQGKMETTGGEPPVSFHTTTPPPEVPGEPQASSVTDEAAVLSAAVNPEHATARYHFEYAACENDSQSLSECGEVKRTSDLQSAQYGLIGVTQEAIGLAAQTPYRFLLVANNQFEYKGKEEGGQSQTASEKEGRFKTGRLPVPQAMTGATSAITATTAVVSGTANPDGRPATYTFELGVYGGAATQYGIVFSGPAGASTVWVQETLALSGLQPGTEYAYRIKVKSGYGESTGTTLTFTTPGLPSVLIVPTVLAQLSVPNVAFPKEPAKVTPKKLTRAQQLASALKACAKKPKSKRVACRRSAHKKYAVTKTKGKKK